MPVFMSGISLRRYRGIGSEQQYLDSFKNFNFFIGANNAGKSAVLNFLSDHIPLRLQGAYDRRDVRPLTDLEQYDRGAQGRPYVAFPMSKAFFIETIRRRMKDGHHRPEVFELINKIATAMSRDESIWMGSLLPYGDKLEFEIKYDAQSWIGITGQAGWGGLWTSITQYTGGGSVSQWINDSVGVINGLFQFQFPSVKLIPAIRQITADTGNEGDFSGRGLIQRLAEVQNPTYDRQSERELFDKINAFLQNVTDTPTARIEIPHSIDNVSVHMNGQVLPLASLGTGIHEVIMIAAYCTFSEKHIVCIEEPEIHLHPILQRKLIKYLAQNTNNQYFIATHSASFIDTPGAAIFHVTHDGVQTYIKESILKSDRFNICVSLGYRASDIVQSNAVIWVEGPTERIYLNHWIAAIDPTLEEGIHYSIMFYGGRLLSHLSAQDNEVSAFISLRALNRNLAVLMDSDRETAGDGINDTKQRIVDEFAAEDGIAWVTAGREIENYVDPALLHKCLKDMYPEIYARAEAVGRYDHAFFFRTLKSFKPANGRETNLKKDADKVKLARRVVAVRANLDILDLKQRISSIVMMIRAAND